MVPQSPRGIGLSRWVWSWLLAGSALLATARPGLVQPQKHATFDCGSLGTGGDTCLFDTDLLGLMLVPKTVTISVLEPADTTISGANAADDAGDLCTAASAAGTATIELACPAGLGVGGTVAVAFSTAQIVSGTITFSDDQGRSSALDATFAYPPPAPLAAVLGGVPVTYDAGWNLVGGPTGWNLYSGPGRTALAGPFYTYQADDSDYELIPGGAPPTGTALPAGVGAWAYFPTSTTVTPSLDGAWSIAVPLPPSHWVMIADPDGFVAATVSGADAVYTYDPASGYVQTTTLEPGQGAWAWSATGGIAVVASHLLPPPHNPPHPPPRPGS